MLGRRVSLSNTTGDASDTAEGISDILLERYAGGSLEGVAIGMYGCALE